MGREEKRHQTAGMRVWHLPQCEVVFFREEDYPNFIDKPSLMVNEYCVNKPSTWEFTNSPIIPQPKCKKAPNKTK